MKTIYLLILFLVSVRMTAYAQDTIPAPSSGRHNSAIFKKDKGDDNSIMTFDGSRSTSRVPSKFAHKKNVGMGLTIAGISMFTVGAILIATAPYRTYTYPNGQTYTSTSPGGVIGILMIPASLALTIPGAVIWGRYAHKIKTGATR